MLEVNKSLPNNQQFIALLDFDESSSKEFSGYKLLDRKTISFNNGDELTQAWEKQSLNIVAIVSKAEILGNSGIELVDALRSKKFPNVPILLISSKSNDMVRKLALKAGIADVFNDPIDVRKFETRLNFLIDTWHLLQIKTTHQEYVKYKTPTIKRIFDIAFASFALLVLSPLFALVYILIKLESNGPVFYYSMRVGTNYKIFKFYKFRSMFVNADQRLKDLKHLNQYDATQKTAKQSIGPQLCDECTAAGIKCQFPLFNDNMQWCEKDYVGNKKSQAGSAFIKIKDDPRITKVGKVIRNTSIDELPQLWNVIIGDMSIVGNRPLPLYESEKLTTDKYAQRFMAPAGITGLWQVEKRGGKGEMSEEERLMLDNTYAQNHSFWYDIKLIFRTIPALFQKENV